MANTNTAFLPIGITLVLVGFILFIIYIGQSLLVAIVALAVFASVGVLLVMKSQPNDV